MAEVVIGDMNSRRGSPAAEPYRKGGGVYAFFSPLHPADDKGHAIVLGWKVEGVRKTAFSLQVDFAGGTVAPVVEVRNMEINNLR